jgi:ABC-type molybdate transport system substrate-binding protein
LLDPNTKLGTSTPKADPSGDYAWEVFRKADALKPGSFGVLSNKALQLTGGSSPPQFATSQFANRNIYGALIADGKADIFLTYCTNARVAVTENPRQHIVTLPPTLAVGADYGLTVMTTAPPAAYRLALFILSQEGQHVLANHGFSVTNLPSGERQ